MFQAKTIIFAFRSCSPCASTVSRSRQLGPVMPRHSTRRPRLSAFPVRQVLNPSADLASIKTLSRLLADVRPDLVQSFDTKPNLLVPLAARGAPSVLVARTINGMGWLYSSGSLKARALRPVYLALHRLAARTTAATVFQNLEDQAFFSATASSAGGGVRRSAAPASISNGSSGIRPPGGRAELREALGFGASPVVITVTRMTRHKGIPTLLEAAALVHKVRPEVRFLLVGPRDSEGPLAVAQTDIHRHAPYVDGDRAAIGRARAAWSRRRVRIPDGVSRRACLECSSRPRSPGCPP